MNTPTPRTDIHATTLPAGTFGPGNQIAVEIVLADFARALERELIEAKARIQELEKDEARLNWMIEAMGSDVSFGAHDAFDFADGEQWQLEGGNDDAPEIRKAFRKMLDAEMKP